MGLVESKGHSRILRDRRWEDYRSLKQYFRNNDLEEFVYEGHHESAGAVAEIQADSVTSVAYLNAEAMIYARSEADLAALDGDSVYVDYLDDAGVIHETETLLDNDISTDTEVPLGCEALLDTVASVAGKTITLTALGGTLNQYAGMYVVGVSGDQKGVGNLIISNTAATPTVITLTDTPNANYAADIISIQSNYYDDVYRIRKMTCETEAPTDNNIWLCDHDGSNKYGVISDANSQAAITRYFTPAATTGRNTKYFLGKIQARGTIINEGDTTATGFILGVRYTPKAVDANTPAADIYQELEFNEFLNWEPCIELEPATDVTISIGDNGTAGAVHVSLTVLEIDRIST